MMPSKNKPIMAIVILGLFLNSCSFDADEFDFEKLSEVKWNPEYAIPLVYGSVSIADLLSDQDSLTLKQKEDGLLYFEYEEILESRNLNEVIYVPSHVHTKRYQVSTIVTVPANSNHILFNSQETVNIESNPEIDHEQLYEVKLKGGKINYEVAPFINADADVEITFPTLKDAQGTSLKVLFSINKGQVQPSKGSLDLANCILDLSTLSPAYNRYPMLFKATIKGGASGTTVLAGTYYDLKVSMVNLDYQLIKGYFGQQTVQLDEDEISVGTLIDLNDAEISIVGAKVDLVVINGYRIPSQVNFNYFEARKGVQKLPITTNPSTPITINFPTQADQAASTDVSVTNASEVFNFRPTALYYKAVATINPTGVASTNYIKDTDLLKLKLKAEAPLYGIAKGIVLNDTLELSLADDIEDHDVEKALLKLKIENEFPLQASVQVYMTNENYTIIDSLFTSADQKNLIVPSQVDQNGNLQTGGAGKYEKIIELSSNRFDNFLDAKYLILKTNMNTLKVGDTYPNVKFKAGYRLKVDIGIQTKLELSIN